MMERDDDVSKSIRQLCDTYDTAINSPFVQPELRLQQSKNDQRLAERRSDESRRTATISHSAQEEDPISTVRSTHDKAPMPLFNPSAVSFELVDFEETTVALPYQRVAYVNGRMAGKSIYQKVQERQAALKEADSRGTEKLQDQLSYNTN
jgi:hypothetical protein